MSHERAPGAPGDLELVRRFVNTWDVEAGIDQLAGVETWTTWAEAEGLAAGVGPVDLQRLRELREALRVGMLANHELQPAPEKMLAALEAGIDWSGAKLQVTLKGLVLVPVGDGAKRLVGAVVAATVQGLADSRWNRLKACLDDTCRWAFYDHSRSRTGHWCSMEICGNRAKQARWRDRQRK